MGKNNFCQNAYFCLKWFLDHVIFYFFPYLRATPREIKDSINCVQEWTINNINYLKNNHLWTIVQLAIVKKQTKTFILFIPSLILSNPIVLSARISSTFLLSLYIRFADRFVHFLPWHIPSCLDLQVAAKTINFVVKLCVHFCVCVSKNLRKWTQTDTKVTFHPPPTTNPPPTRHQETFFGLIWKVRQK